MQVTIAGSGGWGTALAILLHENGHDVTLWSHFETESKQLAETHQNPYLPGVTLPEGLHYSADPACAQGKEMVVFATPSFAVRTTAHAFAPYLAETPLLVSVTKGIEEGTGYRMSELVSQETGRTVVALSGPSHAEEVSRGIPTGVVVACPEPGACRARAERLHVQPFPRLHQPGHGRYRAGRGTQKRHRPLRRCLRRHGLRRQHQGPAHDARALPRSPGWAWRSARTARPSPVWPVWAT